jgi:uncharacterized membrane protein YdbT with pleckstrin-like domain
MLSSVEKILEEGEELEETVNSSLFDTRYFAKYVFSLLGVLLVSLGVVYLESNFSLPFEGYYLSALVIIPILYGGYTEVQRRFKMYHFTDRKIILEQGILDKQWKSLYYTDVTHVELIQNIEERIFGVSDLYIDTAGEAGTELTLNGVDRPHYFQKKISKRSKEEN